MMVFEINDSIFKHEDRSHSKNDMSKLVIAVSANRHVSWAFQYVYSNALGKVSKYEQPMTSQKIPSSLKNPLQCNNILEIFSESY